MAKQQENKNKKSRGNGRCTPRRLDAHGNKKQRKDHQEGLGIKGKVKTDRILEGKRARVRLFDLKQHDKREREMINTNGEATRIMTVPRGAQSGLEVVCASDSLVGGSDDDAMRVAVTTSRAHRR